MSLARIYSVFYFVVVFYTQVSAQTGLVFKAKPLDLLAIYFPYSVNNDLPIVHFPNRSCPAKGHQNDTLYCQVPYGAGTGKIYVSHNGIITQVANKFYPDFAPIAWKEPNYTETFSLPHPVNFGDPCIADFNEDGLPDIALPNSNWVSGMKSPLSLLLNHSRDGEIILDFEHIILPDSQFFTLRYLTAYDLDADGDIDLLAGTENKLVLFRNTLHQTGKMEFDMEYLDSFDLPLSGLCVADINKDGVDELLVSAQTDLFLLSTPSWNNPILTKQAFELDSTMYYELACADFNVDGYLDIAIGHSLGLKVLWGKSHLADTSAFPKADWFLLNDGIPRHYLDADYLHMDSTPELLVNNRANLEKIKLGNNVTGTSIIQTKYYYSYNFSAPEIVDLNFDGALEFLNRGAFYNSGSKNIYTFHDTGKIPLIPSVELPRGNDFQNWKVMSADLDTNGISEIILFNYITFKSVEVFQKWDVELEEKLTNKFMHKGCASDSIQIGDGKQMRHWKLSDTSMEEVDSAYWLQFNSVPSVYSKPIQGVDSSETVWNGDFSQQDTLGSAKLNVIYNPQQKGFIQVLRQDSDKLIWLQKIKVKPYSIYSFSFDYSYVGFGNAQPIPIQFYAGSNQWSEQIILKASNEKHEAFEFHTGDEEEIEIALFFNSYLTFFPIPQPVVHYWISDISCIQSGWVWRLDSLVAATSHPKPIIQQEENKLKVSPLVSSSQISWYHNNTLVGTHSEFELGTSDSGNYVACAETKTLCQSCSDTLFAKRWNPLSIPAQKSLHWKVYPNPAKHTLNVKSIVGVGINLYTIQGICVYQASSKFEHTIPVEHLAPGIYILKGEVNGNSIQQKVVVQ